MVKFTLLPPVPRTEEPVTASLKVENDGSILLILQRGNYKAEPLRITADGRLAKIIGQRAALQAMGIQVESGVIKEGNHSV